MKRKKKSKSYVPVTPEGKKLTWLAAKSESIAWAMLYLSLDPSFPKHNLKGMGYYITNKEKENKNVRP